jgi:uncharacterized protein (TIGR03435 family)
MNVIAYLSAQPWVEHLGWTLVHFLWQGVAIGGLYAITRGLFARFRNPQLRYGLACATLAAMVAAPIATFIVSNSTKPLPPAVLMAGSAPKAVAIVAPVPFESLPLHTPIVGRNEVMPWLVMTWFVGATALSLHLIGGCVLASRMKSSAVREAPVAWRETLDILKARMGVSAPVRMLVSATVQVPTVVGWLTPVILFPVGMLTGLAPDYVKALLAHELAHIRRRDYLVSVVQSIAEAMLFYHPAVWWISSQIRMERELCSDDAAVAVGGDALAYVRALAGLESSRARQGAPLLAANGGSLSNRIARVLGQSRTAAFSLPGVGMVVCGAILTVTACGFLAGAADTRPAFEVASVKPDASETGVDRIDFSKGSVIIVNVSLKRLIGMAYGVAEGRDYLFSGPQWVDSERFDITAKFPPETPKAEVLLMLQRLLEERFALKLHREDREFSVYALTIAKGGPKLHPTLKPGPYRFSAQPGHATGFSLSMPQFADRLSRPVFQLERQVVDFTGLTGEFDIAIDWRPERTVSDDDPGALAKPSIFSALSGQLGLKLEPRKTRLDVLVVDSANKVPTPN